MIIKEYARPSTLNEAYEILTSKEGANLIGGGAYIRLWDREINTAIDLSNLNLTYIKDKDQIIEIGAMTSLRQIEVSPTIKNNFNGILVEAVKPILGVQMRNIFTIGGSICGKYGFSDVITALLSLDTYLEFYHRGKVSLEDFLKEDNSEKDILTKVLINKDGRKVSFKSLRNTSTDFAVLNVAVSRLDKELKIAVGARPGIAKLALEAMKFAKEVELNEENIQEIGKKVAEELKFTTNLRGSAEYREEVCKALVKRAVMEVI